MRIHYIIHAPFERLGAIESWIKKNNHSASSSHTYRGDILPAVTDFDFLIIMGGPQSAVTLDQYPYLQAEIDLAKQAVAANKVVLGVCLGAQLLSVALGGQAEHSPAKEIGVFPISVTPAGLIDPLFKHFPDQFDVMHWHSDMPGLTDNIVVLAESAGCPRQAFRYSDRVYGFQCHLELTSENVAEMLKYCHDDLTLEQYVQSADVLQQQDLTGINQKMHMVLDYLASVSINT